ncbi:hypothetical protein EVAR_57052_1 [Eumeta japonica]|uniref:Uncharacterized protein n=1 Tax=Eumeta variegata TaxID=151549 RepID=A0A4C1YTC9_EUMVA|nr:hypothetical protein EVAR_57052_1 [Eumeta japonica]
MRIEMDGGQEGIVREGSVPMIARLFDIEDEELIICPDKRNRGPSQEPRKWQPFEYCRNLVNALAARIFDTRITGCAVIEPILNSFPKHMSAHYPMAAGCPTTTGCNLKIVYLMLRCTRPEFVNCANGPLRQHQNSMNIRGVSPEQDAIRHQTMETAKINQSSSFDV